MPSVLLDEIAVIVGGTESIYVVPPETKEGLK